MPARAGDRRSAAGGEIHDRFPDAIDPAGRYVIYSHGLIVEGDDPRPLSPELGVYDFPAVVGALAAGSGFHLIAHHRPKNTVPGTTRRGWTGGSAVCWRRKSRRAASRWSGPRRGGQITALASSRLASTGKKHGAFFQPLPEWVRPLRAWIEKTNR